MLFYQLTEKDILNNLQTTKSGLSANEARRRLKKYGKNAIMIKGVPLWKKIIEPFVDVFTLVLLLAAAISFWQDEHVDGIIILVIIATSAVIFYVQRFSTERVLRNLNRRTIEKNYVIRNGQSIKINSTDIVPGDIVKLSEGEKIPADIRLIKAANLQSDESVLTGESLPVTKLAEAITGKKQVYEQTNMLFSGAFIISGTAEGVAVVTGNNTEFGNIASLSRQDDAKSPVQRKIDKLITKIITVTLAASMVAFGLSLLRGMEITESLRFVITLAVSAIPEGLPVAISVILVLGMRRMAAKKALVNNMRAIETLGITTTIATDKTGTLTKNQLSVQETWDLTSPKSLAEAVARSVNQDSNLSDPIDLAFAKYSEEQNVKTGPYQAAKEVPFNQELAISGTIWHNGEEFRAFIKGAPESLVKYSSLSKKDSQAIKDTANKLAEKGYRIMALASATLDNLPKNASELIKTKLTFEGLVAVADTLRPEAAKAIKTALAAGVSVRMITGDLAETAFQIGKDLKMVSKREEVFDCRELDKYSDKELLPIIDRTKVFARVIPEQKYRLLTLLKKRNITAMTGDGVNDVPALSNAHIGIAMGSGSHIAKDAGDMILLDNNFKSIIDAIREGRVVIANIKRILFYLLATNSGEVLVMLGALIIGTRLPLEPVQILWVNLVTDTSMVIPLGLEPAERDVMKQKPAKANAPILNRTIIVRIALVALTIGVITLATYILFSVSFEHQYAQTLAFTALVVSQWGHAFSARSTYDSVFSRLKTMNYSFYVGLAVSMTLQALVLFGPLGSFLHIAPVDTWHIIIVSMIAFAVPIIVSEIHKFYIRKRNQSVAVNI